MPALPPRRSRPRVRTAARIRSVRDELRGLVTAVDHVGIAVADVDAAITYYRETFGLEATHIESNEEQGVREAMLSAPGDGTGATQIQLLAPLREDSAITKFLDRNGPGLQQLAFRVTDVDAASEILRAKGLRLLYDTPRRGTANSRINFVHPTDAGGVLVELVEPAAQPGCTGN
jgi:methylmalonyl-CoA/ethylmalonyl-CoA epimerase